MTKPNTKDWENKRSKYWQKLTDILEAEFSKGISKERGHALVLLAYAEMALQQSRQEFAEELIEEIEELRGKLICDGDFGCGQKPPFIPRQEATCGSSFGKHLALVSKYEAFSQVLEILKK